MLFLYVAQKGTGGDAARAATRIEHLEYMISHRADVVTGGSFQDASGGWGGMALIVDLADEHAVKDWVGAEPYNRAGVFGSTVLAPFRQLVPEPEDGLLERELLAERSPSPVASSVDTRPTT